MTPSPADRSDAAALDRTIQRYRACRRFTRHYVASKIRRDPVHRALLRLGRDRGFGDVADLGCGRGQVAVALLEAGVARSVVGLDWAARSLGDAQQAAAGLAFTGVRQDLAQPDVPACDTALLVDVLYSMGQPAALALLRAAAGAARGRVVIRTLDPAQGVRSVVTRTLERLGRRVWPHAGATVAPVPVPTLMDALREAGFVPEPPQPCWEGTPFANVLIVARRTMPPEVIATASASP